MLNIQNSKDSQNSKDTYNEYEKNINYKILKQFNGHYIKNGRYAGNYKNPYWLVYDEIDEKEFYLIRIKNNIFTKISKESIDDIKNNWEICSKKISWYLNKQGYVSGNIYKLKKTLLLHQVVTNYYGNGKGTKNLSIDHINRDKLDNRKSNLRIVNFTTQHNNTKGIIKGTKRNRKHNAQKLPEKLTQKMMPKYCNYNTEIIKGPKGDYTREFFRIEKHPKLTKKCWSSSKSVNVSLLDKLEQTKKKLHDLDNDIPEKVKIIPKYVRIAIKKNKKSLVYDRRYNGVRQNLRFMLKVDLKIGVELMKEKVYKKYGFKL
jgi:hypothetical protein